MMHTYHVHLFDKPGGLFLATCSIDFPYYNPMEAWNTISYWLRCKQFKGYIDSVIWYTDANKDTRSFDTHTTWPKEYKRDIS